MSPLGLRSFSCPTKTFADRAVVCCCSLPGQHERWWRRRQRRWCHGRRRQRRRRRAGAARGAAATDRLRAVVPGAERRALDDGAAGTDAAAPRAHVARGAAQHAHRHEQPHAEGGQHRSALGGGGDDASRRAGTGREERR